MLFYGCFSSATCANIVTELKQKESAKGVQGGKGAGGAFVGRAGKPP
jgi:hypothetical protein